MLTLARRNDSNRLFGGPATVTKPLFREDLYDIEKLFYADGPQSTQHPEEPFRFLDLTPGADHEQHTSMPRD